VSVTFSPTSGAAYTGNLTVNSNASNSPLTWRCGAGIGSTTNLALSGSMTASSSASGYPAVERERREHQHVLGERGRAGYPQTLTANLGKS
jgi:hypothetical protein